MSVSIENEVIRNLALALVVIFFTALVLAILYGWFRWVVPTLLWLIISYSLKPDKIIVKLFHVLPIGWISISNIADIREVDWNFDVFFRGATANKPFAKSFVSIKLKRGLFYSHRYSGIILTPKDPAMFVEQVKSSMSQLKNDIV